MVWTQWVIGGRLSVIMAENSETVLLLTFTELQSEENSR